MKREKADMILGDLRILFVEDAVTDVELEERELRKGGLVFKSMRIESRDDLIHALNSFKPDLIISDHSLPHMDGLMALRIARELCPDVPFIFVSGTIGEERAVQSLKEGATDYVVKGRLERLVPVVERALKESRERVERRQLEEEYRQAQKMEAIGRLAGGVAHDFNNLLTAILGYGQLILSELEEKNPLHEYASEVVKAGERAATLTRQLLVFSRKQILQPKPLDLNAIVREMERMLRRVIGENIDLLTSCAPQLGRVHADAGQIEQVLMNLVVNARDAMPDGGKLTIETAEMELDRSYAEQHSDVAPGKYVVLAVTDTGIGMTPDVKARIFEPFFTTKGAGQGTGLGLSTVYGIVNQSGGHIVLYSEPGHGTSFKICLPRVDEAPEPAPPPADGAPAASGSETILLVEDEEIVRRLARNVLSEKGYRVLEAVDGKSAVDICNAHLGPIDLLLTDLVMPGMSGRDLALYIHATRPSTKVLFMSGYSEGAVIHQGMLEEHTPFLSKPFSPDALVRHVRETLDRAPWHG
jgi:two-component system, cell cycle sensor histidine kinase and response regulator CckA